MLELPETTVDAAIGSAPGTAAGGGGKPSSAAITGAALLLAACGSGGAADGGDAAVSTPVTTAPPVVVVPAAITPSQASRFLAQSTMGATRAQIDVVVAKGYSSWIDEQIALPRATTQWDWLIANGYNVAANLTNQGGFDASMWRQLIVEPDQLRQRIGMALLDILVVGIDGLTINWSQFAMAAYVDILLDNAFGNYRNLMNAVTYNFAMAHFLTFMGNKKANPSTGAQPDENYARELMQLFTLGLYQLNMDGTVKTSGGVPLETYGPADVSGLARVFTGLWPANNDGATPDRLRLPLMMNAAAHEGGASSFLGTTVSGEGNAAIKTALDTIFSHPNLPPFISKQLIQRLVTSNPSPAYVGRVSAVFADNGSGVRGDMKAVIRAILLDMDARGDTALTSATAGKLRDPVMRLTGWARAFGVTSPSNAWAIGNTSNPTTRLGQSMGRSPSVFNFFRPGYTPPATAIATAGLVAPEFQITNEQSVIGYINYMQVLIGAGTGDVKADYTAILTKAADTNALVEEMNIVLAAGQLSPTTVAAIRGAVDSVSATGTDGPINRVGIAILLTLASPEYLAVK